MTIWKYPLIIEDEQTLQMPRGAVILSAQVQHGSLFLWAMVDPTQPHDERDIEIIGTGMEFSEAPRNYIGTVQMAGGNLVWHIFEKP